MQPQTLRLLGPISPTRTAPPQMPKSRTMGMLSSLTSSFSRSNLNLSTSSRQTSVSSARSTVSISSISSPMPLVTTSNTRQIHTAQPNSYWSGRFQGLNDRTYSYPINVSIYYNYNDNTRKVSTMKFSRRRSMIRKLCANIPTAPRPLQCYSQPSAKRAKLQDKNVS
jgi:hypothetical protein